VLLIVCLTIVAWIILVLIAVGQVTAACLDGRDALMRARDAAMLLDFDTAGAELSVADSRFGTAERGFGIIGTLRFLPWISGQASAAHDAISGGREMIVALQPVVELGSELVRLTGFSQDEMRQMREGLSPSATFDDLSPETKRAILERLSSSAPDLEYLAARISIVRSELASLESGGASGPVIEALAPIDSELAKAEISVRTLSIAAGLLPEFAGLGQERTLLLLFLNNAELRPGGGFIGTFGILTMKDGEIVRLETRDSYALDHPAEPFVTESSPAPLARYNATPLWFFRDANWSPDFYVSAQTAARLYGREVAAIPADVLSSLGLSSTTFDGALGVTPTFLESLMWITGPISVDGQTFSAENVSDKLEYQVEVGYVGQGIPEAQRKEVVADLLNALKAELYSMPLSEWPDLINVVQLGFSGRQVALMSFDESVQDFLSHAGWSGEVLPGDGDSQLVVDANMASLKSDPKVSRSIQYEIFKNTGGQYVGRTAITYAHVGSFDWKTTRYRTYARLYVPQGSQLIRVEGSMLDDALHNPAGLSAPVDVADDLGMTSFGTFVSIEPGETKTLAFEYLLADSVVEEMMNGTYSLSFLKQLGAQDIALTLDLNFDKNVTDASVPEDRSEWGDDVYRLNTNLDQNRKFTVTLKP